MNWGEFFDGLLIGVLLTVAGLFAVAIVVGIVEWFQTAPLHGGAAALWVVGILGFATWMGRR